MYITEEKYMILISILLILIATITFLSGALIIIYQEAVKNRNMFNHYIDKYKDTIDENAKLRSKLATYDVLSESD